MSPAVFVAPEQTLAWRAGRDGARRCQPNSPANKQACLHRLSPSHVEICPPAEVSKWSPVTLVGEPSWILQGEAECKHTMLESALFRTRVLVLLASTVPGNRGNSSCCSTTTPNNHRPCWLALMVVGVQQQLEGHRFPLPQSTLTDSSCLGLEAVVPPWRCQQQGLNEGPSACKANVLPLS